MQRVQLCSERQFWAKGQAKMLRHSWINGSQRQRALRRLATLVAPLVALPAPAGAARATTGTYSAEVLADQPLVYYRLGDGGLGVGYATMLDSSGNARNGVYSTSGNVTQGVASALLSDT